MASKRWWQFWKKKQPSNVIEPLFAAVIPIDRLFSREKPFDEWKPSDTQVRPEHADFIRVMVEGYQLFTYLQLIEAKFGLEITRVIREYQIIALNRLPESEAGEQISLLLKIISNAWKTANDYPIKIPEYPDLRVPVEASMSLHLLTFTKDSPYYIPPELRTEDSINGHILEDDFLDLGRTLAECLMHGKNAAVEIFDPIIQFIELKPETISGLHRPTFSQKADRQPSDLIWSQNPGFHERHLQRKDRNPLFPPPLRVVKQEEIDTARMRDLNDAETLRKELYHLIGTNFSVEKVAGFSALELGQIREKIDDLMRQAAKIGGDDGDEIGKSLVSLRSALMADWRDMAKGNTEALNALDKAERFVEENINPFHNRFLAQMSRLDSADIVPALLSEDPETIRLVLKQMGDNSDSYNLFQAASLRLLAENFQANPPIPQLQEKLRILGVPEPIVSVLKEKER